MKKILLFASALAGLFLAGSCQRENLEPMESANTVTYTVQVPGALSTKTIGENVAAVTELVYEVYRTEATSEDDFTQAEALLFHKTTTIENGTATVEFELVNDQNFRVLFWAQVPGNGVYDVTSLKNVKISQDLNANAENYAAFAGADYIKAGESIVGRTLPLVRPIAQLNIGTDDASLWIEDQTKAQISTSAIKVNGLSTSYNVAEDKAGEISADDYVYAAKPVAPTTEYPGLSESTFAVNGTPYNYVAMNYVGFAPQMGTNVEVTYTINTENVGTIENTIDNVPVKANHRTNIIGNLITSMSDYTITLDNEWPDEEFNVEVVSVATVEELQEAIKSIENGTSGNIKLEDDIDLGALVGMISTKSEVPTYGLLIPADKSLVLDLNGNILYQEVNQTGAYSMIQNNGNLTIVDSKGTGKIAYEDKGNGGEYVSNTIVNNGRLVIESGLIENNSSATVASNGYPHPVDNNGELIINGGTLTNNANYASMRIWCTTDDNTSVTINGGTFNGSIDFQTPSASANKGSLTINGGTFNADAYTKCAVRLLGFGADVDEMLGYINGGTFNGEIALRNWSGSELNSQVFYITGGQFSVDPTAFVVDGYPVNAPETEGGYYTIGQFTPVAKIGDVEYGSLKAAVAAVQDGETITLVNNIRQVDGVIITDKNITIDLNDKTYTVTNGANTNNRNFKINGSSVVTIMNGTMVAAGDYSSGAYGTVRTEGTANVTLTDVKLYNYRGNGLNVKALSGTTVTISDTEVYSQYGGGIESAGGTIELTNVKVEQKGMYTAPYNSMAISVNGGGTVTVNSGTYSTECITAEEANNQGTSHGPWCAGVLNSGGTLIIKGGTFSNDNFGDNSLATYARGLLLADTGATIQVEEGTFNAVKNIVDIQNNLGDASKQPKAVLTGGTYSSNPLTYEGFITVAEGYKVEENNGAWNVVVDPAAQIGTTAYDTLEAAAAAAKAGDTITVLRDATLSAELTLPANVTLNGNGKQINGTIYAGGNLTFAGHTKVTSFSASYYNRTITIGEGACLEVTGGGRVTLGYGNTFNITGSLENAKTADKANVQPSLIIPAGISITGGNDAAMNVTNAYVQIGSTSSKNSAANGVFTLNFTNSIAEFTNQLTFAVPTSGKTPTFNLNITDSVLNTGTKLIAAAPKTNVKLDNSIVTLATYFRNSGKFEVVNGSVLTGSTIQFGENGGNDGALIVDASEVTITATSTGHALDGKGTGSITLTNGAKATVTYYKDMTVNVDAASEFTGTQVQ